MISIELCKIFELQTYKHFKPFCYKNQLFQILK